MRGRPTPVSALSMSATMVTRDVTWSPGQTFSTFADDDVGVAVVGAATAVCGNYDHAKRHQKGLGIQRVATRSCLCLWSGALRLESFMYDARVFKRSCLATARHPGMLTNQESGVWAVSRSTCLYYLTFLAGWWQCGSIPLAASGPR